mmetsp:Transcript_35799/g.82158  ORF Transcript_35799/g.82158 Transcript_35799/m.82158 type:complete len:274 (+) Transcript_35799:168-989(+)
MRIPVPVHAFLLACSLCRLALGKRATFDVPLINAEVPSRWTNHAAAGMTLPTGSDLAAALKLSSEFMDSEAPDVEWVAADNSAGLLPAPMVAAEIEMDAFLPQATQEEVAKMALQLYHHAKWCAESHKLALAESRYRRAAQLALQSRRSVLAGHALARLGYFLIAWHRKEEARIVLREAHECSKSNSLAAFLLGMLEREAPSKNGLELAKAEELILTAGVQPSEDLEQERQHAISDITYWRTAELSVWDCAASRDVAQVMICLSAHLASALQL